ncbi:MAG TPA: M81 family metallopeptidase [Pirellulales bacterium]|nr:M81 family metallopeptidase [Pirellulales bacterium]
MRVGIIALQHESNTFCKQPTTLSDFQKGALLTGADIRKHYGDSHHEVGGFFAGLEEADIEPVPIFLAWALPGGKVAARALEDLLSAMLHELKKAEHLDGLLVAPHGAGVAENAADMDGSWLRELRSRVGPHMPIVGTLDLHANLSETMVRATNALLAYRTNPHLDQRERGIEAARLIARMLTHEARPTQAAAFPPLVINIDRQNTSTSPCRDAYEALEDLLSDQHVLAASLLLGFPYSDVREMGASVLVVTNDNPDLARHLADDFADYLRLRRDSYVGQLTSVDGAIERALRSPGPVCLLDMGDNVGGGSPADGTVLLHALIRKGVAKSFVCLCDPASVEASLKAGIGATLEMALGGKTDPRHGDPVKATVRIRGIYDGHFVEPQARHGGRTEYEMGQTIVAELSTGQTVMLNSRRIAPVSLVQLTCCHLNPCDFQIIVAKGVHSPVAAYAPVCPTMLRANTPGVTTADLSQLEYQHRRSPLFPFEK